LFLTAVISFYFTQPVLRSPLSTVLCQGTVVISVITTSSNHAGWVNFTALLFEPPIVLMKAYC